MDFSQFLPWAYFLVQNFGYPGIFLTNLIGSATVLLPLPVASLVFVFGAILNPWLLGISAALGATLGEIIGYGIGRGGGTLLEKKYERFFSKGKKWFEKGRGFLVIVFFAATPLPDDVVGILGGIFHYNFKKFILASLIGKMIMNLALALGGFYGLNWILNIFKISF